MPVQPVVTSSTYKHAATPQRALPAVKDGCRAAYRLFPEMAIFPPLQCFLQMPDGNARCGLAYFRNFPARNERMA